MDSFYEYLLKTWIGFTDETEYGEMFLEVIILFYYYYYYFKFWINNNNNYNYNNYIIIMNCIEQNFNIIMNYIK